MVTKNSTNQYSRRMGQKTGTSKNVKNVIAVPTRMDLNDAYLPAEHTSTLSQQATALDASGLGLTLCSSTFAQRVRLTRT
jgi:hypothetical protein